MGLSTRQSVHAGHRHGAGRRHDPGKTPRQWRAGGRPQVRACLGLALWLLTALCAGAETLRIATYNADLTRRGPGLLLRDITSGTDAQIVAVTGVIVALDADLLLITGMDYDHGHAALGALADTLAAAGAPYPYRFALRPNTGVATGLDLDGNGRKGEARDAQGYGRFVGAEGMALLSRLPVKAGAVRDFSGYLWRDFPGAMIPDGMAPGVLAVQRLSSTGHWEVPVTLPGGGTLRLLAWHATPPVFDGPEDRNGRRNHDEAAFWLRLMEGVLPMPPPEAPFVLLGDGNLDPADGDGRSGAIAALLAHPALQDAAPRGGEIRTDPGQTGDPALDTALYDDIGGLRVDYVLPGRDLRVLASGVLWPPGGDPLAAVLARASRHRPVWVDIALPQP